MATIPPGFPWRPLVVVLAAVGSLLVLRRFDRSGSLREAARSRFVLGVPWGTVLTVLFVLFVYLFVQGGFAHPRNPVVIAFRTWSYYYPLGMLTAAFSHAGRAHILGNLVGTVAFGTVAEYAWSHYPRERGTQTFTSLRTNPYARILAVPGAAILVGLFTALFSLGAVVGFSGVVFAFAGFALVTRPITTVLALVGGQIVHLLVDGLLDPSTVYTPKPRVTRPWWAQVAVHDHAMGLMIGVLVAALLVWRRDEWPRPARLWFAVLSFAAFQGLWAVYVPLDGGRYRLFRWAGIALVFALVTLVVAATARSDRTLLPRIDLGRREAATGVLVAALLAFSLVAVPYNVSRFGQQAPPGESVQVRDYTVTYAENVTDRFVGAIDVPFVHLTNVRTSGVIVTSARRNIWYTQLTAAKVANQGNSRILLGGVGWRRRVFVNRTGWAVQGNRSVYQVYLRPEGNNRTLSFTSDPSRAAATIAGRNVSIAPHDPRFQIVVSRNGSVLGRALAPGRNASVRVGGLTFKRRQQLLFAVRGTRGGVTRIAIARREP
ncbi:MAG: rhomboid family intramembrane serine protease [Haloarculaceae archaeon]